MSFFFDLQIIFTLFLIISENFCSYSMEGVALKTFLISLKGLKNIKTVHLVVLTCQLLPCKEKSKWCKYTFCPWKIVFFFLFRSLHWNLQASHLLVGGALTLCHTYSTRVAGPEPHTQNMRSVPRHVVTDDQPLCCYCHPFFFFFLHHN